MVDSLTEECNLLVAHIDDRDEPLVKSAIKRRIPIVQGRMLYQAILEHRTDFKNTRYAFQSAPPHRFDVIARVDFRLALKFL